MKRSLLVVLLMSFLSPMAFADDNSVQEALLLKVNSGALLEMKFRSLLAEKQILEQKMGAHQTYFSNDPGMTMALKNLISLGKQMIGGAAGENLLTVSDQEMKIRGRIAKVAGVSKTVAVIYVNESYKNTAFANEFTRIDKLSKSQAFDDFKILLRLTIAKTREIEEIRAQVNERQELITALKN